MSVSRLIRRPAARIGLWPAIVFCLTAIASIEAAAGQDSCSHTIVAMDASPDGAWRALVDEAVCEGGGFASAIVDSVRLVDARQPTRVTDLLGVETGGRQNERPRLRWTGPSRLQVTVPNLSFLKVLAHQVGPITLDLRFDPPDAAARADWLRSLGLSPDADGERSVP